jgi:pimeloyl-ACP methyl ester carboxylesterase
MSRVISKDGTPIAYETAGSGPPLILIDGAMCYRGMGPLPGLARLLAPHFTVVTYDRRGRGESGNGLPWSIEKEIDDIEALVNAVGGSARLFGISSGAALALDAAARIRSVTKVAIYEPPFIVDGTRTPVPDDFIPGLDRLLAEGNRNEVVKRFMRIVGVPGIFILLMRLFPNWPRLAAIAHTVPYDMTIMHGTQSGRALPRERWSSIAAPVLVLDGGKSPSWMRNGCRAAAALLPRTTYGTLPGQTHMVKNPVLAPAVLEYLVA